MATASAENPIIQTTCGKVRGQKTQSIYGHEYYYFDGIPYAKPPIGGLRFRAPQPVDKWPGIMECLQSPEKCLQWNRRLKVIQGSEDCLYLNINVKRLQPHPLQPVMVYIHGGGFNTGDPTRRAWGPDYFMAKDVILITIGYRLGIFGFASLSDKSNDVSDNCGLKDVELALKWIKDNCEHFNGNPDNITLFGHSSGSTMTNLLMQSPTTKGLFHKAILLAGYAINQSYLPKLEYRLAKHLGFKGPEDDITELCDFLTHVEGSKLLNCDIISEEENLLYEAISIFPFSPAVDKGIVHAQRTCWGNSIPLMMGSNSTEGLLEYDKYKNGVNIYELVKNQPKYFLPVRLRNTQDDKLAAKLGKKLQELHFGDKELKCENYECAIENTSYNFMYHDQHRVMQSRLKYATAPTYVYRFDFDSPTFNLYRIAYLGTSVRGVAHVDELCYLFYLPNSYKLSPNSPEYKCIEQMIETLYVFAKTSDPNNHIIQPAHWEPVQRDSLPQCLNINYEWTKVMAWPEYQKCCAIDDIYKAENMELY